MVISWILFLCAGIVGNWERFDGIPETGKRLISLGKLRCGLVCWWGGCYCPLLSAGVAFLVLLGTIVMVALPNWLHEAESGGSVPMNFVREIGRSWFALPSCVCVCVCVWCFAGVQLHVWVVEGVCEP
jgi:hypothetical protein